MKYQLPKEFATKWVAALRETPEEKHHTGELQNMKDKTCYCAIGIYACANNIEISRNGMNMLIGGVVVDYYKDGVFPIGLANEIVNMNDRLSKSFSEIADWIEQNVEFI